MTKSKILKIVELYKAGENVKNIAKRAKMSKGSIDQLIWSLRKKGAKIERPRAVKMVKTRGTDWASIVATINLKKK